MIIILENSFQTTDLNIDRIARDAIEAACGAAAKGHHFIFAGRALLKKLSECAALSMTTRGLCHEILAHYTFLGSIAKKLKYRIEISLTLDVVEKRGDTEWAIPARQIAEHGIRPSILLSENSSDAEVYTHAARHFRLAQGMNDVEINIEPRNGNGAGTPEELRRISRRAPEWCLCVTDSDKECPDGALGATARACGRLIQEEPRAIVWHIATGGRELENVIPSRLFGTVHADLHPDQWTTYQQRETEIGFDALRYADLKLGTSLCRLLRLDANTPVRQFWVRKVDGLRSFVDCIRAQRCDAPRENACMLVDGFGEHAATRVHDYLNSGSTHKTYEIAKNSGNIDDWMAIGSHVFHAGAAPKPLRV